MIYSKIANITIDLSDSILKSLGKMDKEGVKLLFVFDKMQFAGLLTIGDIQRAILKDTNLNSPISLIIDKNKIYALDSDNIEVVKNKMLRLRAECMPVLSEKGDLLDVYFWRDFFTGKRIKQKINLPVVIMAGGKGSRLKPLTNVIPKPLIPINDKTIIEEIMDRFVEYECQQFYLSVNYKAGLIKYYFDKLNNEKYSIDYFQETKPLGTAGSLSLLKDKINTTFFVSNCDILIDQDYYEILKYHKENKNEITIVSTLKHYSIPYGTIETTKGGVLTKLEEKPELTFQINSGMYLLEPELLHEIPENEFFHITDLIDNMINSGRNVGVFPVSEGSWKDIGEWSEYLKHINKYISDGKQSQ